MSEEPSGTSTTNRVITIVQTPLPISSATALDVDASRVVQSGDLSLDGLGGQEKNPFSSFSEEHLSRLDDFLSTEEAQKILQQTTNVEPFTNTQVAGQRSNFNESDTEIGDERSENLLDIFDNKTDHSDIGSPFSDHAYAIPVKRTTRASLTVTSPQSEMSSPKKRGQAKDEVMIVSDVGNDVEISQEETKMGKGRGRGRKSQGEIQLGLSNNRRSSRISDNEQREMAEKIRQENIQKEKEAMEAMKSEEEEDSPKKKPRGRQKKTEDDEEEEEEEENKVKQVGKRGRPKSGTKDKEVESESEDDTNRKEAKTGKRGRPKSGKTAEKEEEESEDETHKSVKGKRGRPKKEKDKDSDSEVGDSPKGKGKKGRSKSRTKKGEDADDESEEETPKKGNTKKTKRKKEEELESESDTESPTKGNIKRGRPKKGKGKQESESEIESPTKGKAKRGRPKKGQRKQESESESETESPKRVKTPKGKAKMIKGKQQDDDNSESESTPKNVKGKKGKAKKQEVESESDSKNKKGGKNVRKGKVKQESDEDEEDSPSKKGKKGKLKKMAESDSGAEIMVNKGRGLKKLNKESGQDSEEETNKKDKPRKGKKVQNKTEESEKESDGETKNLKNKNVKKCDGIGKGKKVKVKENIKSGKKTDKEESSDADDEPLISIKGQNKLNQCSSDKKDTKSSKNIFDVLISKPLTDSSPLKRKNSASDSDNVDVKKVKSDQIKIKHESGDGELQDAELKMTKSVKKKFRKSEDFLDLTMTDLFKPDGVIPNDEERSKASESIDKHKHDSDSNVQSVENVLNNENSEKKNEVNIESDKTNMEEIKMEIKKDEIETEQMNEQINEIESEKCNEQKIEIESEKLNEQKNEIESEKLNEQKNEIESEKCNEQKIEIESEKLNEQKNEIESEKLNDQKIEIESEKLNVQKNEIESEKLNEQKNESETGKLNEQKNERGIEMDETNDVFKIDLEDCHVENVNVDKLETLKDKKMSSEEKDENTKIKEMYRYRAEKTNLNSSADSNIISVTVASDSDGEKESMQFEATIENVEFVSISQDIGQIQKEAVRDIGQAQNEALKDVGQIQNEVLKDVGQSQNEASIQMESILEKLSKEQAEEGMDKFDKSNKEIKSIKKIPDITKETKKLTKIETLKEKTKSVQINKEKEEVQTKKGQKGKKTLECKTASDLDISDMTGSEVEEDSRVLRRKRVRNPLVEEFLKKETRKQRKKTIKSDVENKQTTKQDVKKKSKEETVVEDEDEEEEEDEDDGDSEEEYEPPDQKYCICKKPYDNKFMICCDHCENWYHGKCVGISRARGKEMDENKEEYICDACKEKETIEKVKNKSQSSGCKQAEVTKPLIVKMPGLMKSPKTNKESQMKEIERRKSVNEDKNEGKKQTLSSPLKKVKKVTTQKSGHIMIVKKTFGVKSKKSMLTVGKTEKVAKSSEKNVKDTSTPGKMEKVVSTTGKSEKVSKIGKTEKLVSTPGKTEKVSSTPGKSEKVVSTTGKSEKVVSTPGKNEKAVNTTGKNEKSSSTSGKSDKISSTPGKSDKVSSTPGKSDKVSSTPGKSDKVSSTPGKSDKVSSTPGKSDKVSSTPGKSDKVSSTPGKSDKVSSTPGKSDKVSNTHGKMENNPEIFSPDKVKVMATARKISTDHRKSEEKLPRCIGPKCAKVSRPDSVYCSNECIINHSQDSLNIIHSQQDSVIKLTGDKRIVVIEKTTGKILTGDKAPTEAELCSWLEKNPSFSVLCPTVKKFKVTDNQQQQEYHHSHHQHHHHSHHGNKDHHRDRKDSSKERKSDSSKERKRSHSDSHKDNKSSQKKHDSKHSVNKQGSSHKKDEKTDKSETKPEDTGPDPVRLNVRKSLRDALASRAEKADDVMLSLSEIKLLALDIENELYDFFKETGHKYKAKYRSLIFNIKDSKNKGLFRKILNGELKPDRLIKMTPEELASRELAKWREFETKHELDMIVQAEEEIMKEGLHFVKKTHKGEIQVDGEDEDLSTLEDHGVEKPKLKKSEKNDGPSVDFIGGLIGDTTSQHKKHLFDLNCRICTGKELPPVVDTTPKKVRVARTIRNEESGSSSDKKEKVKTEEEQKKAEDVVKEVLKAIQKAKKEQMEEAKRMEEQKTTEQKPVSSEAVADSTVTVRSPDSALQSGLEQKPDFTPKGPQVWKGFVSMQDVAKFVTTAYRISGPSDKLNIPDTVHVCGRISPEQVYDYLAKMRKVGTKDIIVLRFIPGPNEEKTSYINLYSYLNSRSRCGVVGSVSKYIKDFYILPLASHSKIPSVIKPFVEQGLEKNRPHMLLAVIVRQKLKAHGVELDSKQKHKHDQVQKVRFQEKRPYTPPGQKSYGPPAKVAKIEKKGIDLKKSHAKKSAASTTVTTASSITMTTSPTIRGNSSAGDPIVEVYGSDSIVEEPEPYDPEKPTVDSKPYDPSDTAVFKKPAPIKRPSPSSSPGTSSIKPLRGAATLVSQMMDKLKLSSNATEANEFITEGLTPMATVTDKQKILLELTQRVCEQKKLIELKHAGKSVQEAALPLVAVANAMTAISQISKTLVSAPKRAAISASQQGVKSLENDDLLTSSDAAIIDETTASTSGALSSSSEQPSNVTKTPGLFPHEVAVQSEKMSTMPEALKSLFSSIPGSYSHVTKYEEADPVKSEVKEEEPPEVKSDEQETKSTKSVSETFLQTLKTNIDTREKNVDTESSLIVEKMEEGKNKFNVSLLDFDYGDSDSENEEMSAGPSIEDGDNDTRPSSVMSSSSEESQDSANIAPLQYPPLPEEPAVPPPLPDEPPPPPPDHDPEEEEISDEEEESGKKGKKKKKKKKKGKKDRPAPEIVLEAKDPISKAILDASFRRLMEKQNESMIVPPMSPVVGPNVPNVPISGPVTGPPFQNPTGPGILGSIPCTKPALLPTPVLTPQVATGMMPQAATMVLPPSVPMVQPQQVVNKPIPSLFDVEVTPSKNLNLKKLEGEPENELDRELRDLADADWRTEEPVPQDLDLRQDQDLRIMDVDMRHSINKPLSAPPTIWPEDIDHRKGGRFTPDPLFGSDLQLPSEDSDLRNFCSPLDQDYRRRDMPPKDIPKDNFLNVTEDQDFRVSQNKHGHRRGSHDRDRSSDIRRRSRHDDSSHRKSKRRRRDEDRHHSRHEEDHRHRDRDHRRSDNKDQDHSKKHPDPSIPQDVDQRQKMEKKIPPPPRLADKVPVPPPQVLAQKAASEIKSVGLPKLPPLQPPPLPPGIDIVKFTPTQTPPTPRRSQPPPPGIDDW